MTTPKALFRALRCCAKVAYSRRIIDFYKSAGFAKNTGIFATDTDKKVLSAHRSDPCIKVKISPFIFDKILQMDPDEWYNLDNVLLEDKVNG